MTTIDKYKVDTNLNYDPKEHFWIKLIDNNMARIGMSPLIQETSGAFVAIQIDITENSLERGSSFGMIEAEKHVGPLKLPLSGIITKINEEVIENPRLINIDPYNKGWLIELSMTNPDELSQLISGEINVVEWFRAELKKFDEKGWIAQ